jgi:hypothetical protein
MRRRLSGSLLVAFLAAGFPAAPLAGAPPEPGLARVPSRNFDELYRRVGPDLAAYRQVVVDAPRVEFRQDWLRRMNESRGVTRWIEPAEAAEIAERMAIAMREALRQALAAQGYEIVTAAADGALRLSPSVVDLFVNAPYVPGPGIDVGIVHQDAGQATMWLEVSDAATGTVLARIVDREVARTIGGYEKATSVSNLFWFAGMFQRWAEDCVREIRARSPRP